MSNVAIPALIQQMLTPDFYPHPVTMPIQLMQTHASYVLLTGEFVYKLKKPVNFGFLDYSTVAKRQHFCNEEMRLNQRGAKDLYLAVLAISKQDRKYHLSNDGEIVDYAVKMVQFPQAALLSNMFGAGTITIEHIELMGKVVAQFHANAQTNEYISSFGEVAMIRQSIDDNYRQTEKYIGRAQTQQQFTETKAYTDSFLLEFDRLFNERRTSGFIRECHGDLHLRNICQWKSQILLFDCIEFNEPFRFVDTMYDIAFAVMDLEARGRKDLANRFLNTYAEQTGDWEGLQVLPFYLSRQAYVRAKVTSFLLDDLAISDSDRQAAAKTAGDYYHQAWAYTQNTATPRLIMLSGLSGSGKSTLGKRIAMELGGIHLRSDAVRKHLGGIPLASKGDANLYTPEMTARTYNRVLELAAKLVAGGSTVILDAKYDRWRLRAAVVHLATDRGIPLQIIHCTAPEAVLRDRLAHRTGDIADATADLLASQQADWQAFTPAERCYVTTIDTTQDISFPVWIVDSE
ncbi:AAA family ATPase [Chamaesiphon sp. VAR_48_metabat_403]|uniref:bifunctional aminoglycoside phosphotransferase/ATP-binding protein n=1 Tax=Chamaesiphon sp. VAR_48_metabat_403 TaxID=2964700 RepID=UPI00286DFF54|nr:AAA family ATPase [Chamaesiphon sp. VAR_48_metabat_403]